jgi:hypothetical protein
MQHRMAIETFTADYQPYSDFNFISLLSWDDGSTQLSMLNGNLVIRMRDYTSDDHFYSVLGTADIDETLNTLLKETPRLELVPEIVVQNIRKHGLFEITEDRDQFDYIYPINSHVALAGGQFKDKRNKISKFLRLHGERLEVRKIHFNDPAIQEDVNELFGRWAVERQREIADVEREAESLQRLFKYGDSLNLVGIQVLLDGKFVAFSINELLPGDFAVCHFQKSILSFENIDVFLSNLVAIELRHFGCQYVNWEQDLGIPGLRQLKESYMHEFFLKKFTIRAAGSFEEPGK